MENLKVIILGVGSVGTGIVRTLRERRGVEIVGAVDIDPDKIGRDAGALSGIDPIGVTVTDDLAALCGAVRADVVVNVASPVSIEETFRQVLAPIEAGINCIVAGMETCNLWFTDPALAEQIDAKCREHGVTYVGFGATQTEERFIISMTEGSTAVNSIQFTHYADVQAFSDESNAGEWGISLSLEDYQKGVADGSVKSKEDLKACVPYLANALGWTIDEVSLDKEPMVDAAGRIFGVRATVTGCRRGEVKLEMNWVMIEDPERRYYDHLIIDGTPRVDCRVDYTPDRGMAATIGAIANGIPFAAGAAPGYVNSLAAPACGIIYDSYADRV